MKIKEIYFAPEIDLLELEAEGSFCESPVDSYHDSENVEVDPGEW